MENKLEKRFKSLVKLFNKDKFPIKVMILGFGSITILSKQECLGRIKELSELVRIGFIIETDKTIYEDTIGNQKEEIKEVIKWQQ